jgi:hypothetical protein
MLTPLDGILHQFGKEFSAVGKGNDLVVIARRIRFSTSYLLQVFRHIGLRERLDA